MTRLGVCGRCLRDRRGAVAIEFAAIALPFILLLGGTIEISRYTWTRLALQDAASAGARCLGLQLAPCFEDGSMQQDRTKGFVRQQAMDWGIKISGNTNTVTPEQSADCHGIADFARVGVRHRFTSVLVVLPDTWIDVEACFPVFPSG